MPAVVDIVVFAVLLVAIALLSVLTSASKALRSALNITILFHTFALGDLLLNPLIHALNDAQKHTATAVAGLWSDSKDALVKTLGLAQLAANGLHTAFDTFWRSRLGEVLLAPLELLAGAAHVAWTLANSAYQDTHNTATALPAKITGYVSARVSSAITTAEHYTDSHLAGLEHDIAAAKADLGQRITAVLGTAEHYTDSAVAALRSAEDKAIAGVQDLANEAKKAADTAVATAGNALATAESYTDRAIASARSDFGAAITAAEHAAEQTAAQALSSAQSAINSAITDARTAAANALSAAGADLAAAERYADSQIAGAVSSVRSDAAAALHDAVTKAEADIATALSTAEGAAADALAKAKAAVEELRAATEQEVAAAESYADAAAAKVGGAAQAALEAMKAIAVGAEHELETIEGALGPAGLAALIASIPALATLVHAIADEAGLGNQSCRTKVKGICGTDPAAWAALLAGVAAVGVAFDLADILRAALTIVSDAEGLVAKIGDVAESEVESVGQAIGAAALAIAA